MTHRRNIIKPARKFSGPQAEDHSLSLEPKDVPDFQGTQTDSWKYLVHRTEYPEAGKIHSCLSLQSLLLPPDDDEPMDEAAGRIAYCDHLRAVILKTARETPGMITTGAKHFPMTKEGAIAFFLASGFAQVDVEFLTEEMKLTSIENL